MINLYSKTNWHFVVALALLFFMPLSKAIALDLNDDINITVISSDENPLKTVVSLDVKNATVSDFFKTLKRQTNDKITFAYVVEDLSDIKNITMNLSNVTVEEVLSKLLSSYPTLSYSVVNNVITIKKSTPKKTVVKNRTSYKGVVLSADTKKPITGATIFVVGTTSGAISDSEGRFEIAASPAQKLEITYVGKRSKMITLGENKGNLSISLEDDVLALDEVRVVAYGTSTKREMAGAMTVIKADDIKNIPSSSISNLLQGRVAGMDVTNVTGAPGGGGTQVTIRGYNSLNVESARRFSNPLWVIDGVPMNSFTSPVTGTNSLSDINPETIESIQILKDAAATSLYGSRAANGVILVTTKKGSKNTDAQFSVNFSQTYSILPENPTVYGGRGERNHRIEALRNFQETYMDYDANRYRYPTSHNEAYIKGGRYDQYWGKESNLDGDNLQDSLNSFYNNSTNFYDYYFRPGKVTNANIQTFGGSERMTYSVGAGYYDEKGILKGTGFTRFNLMGNFTVNPVKWLTIDYKTALSMSDRSRGVKNAGFSSGVEVETIPGNPLELSTLLPGETESTKLATDKLRSIEEKNNSYGLRTSFGLRIDFTKNINLISTTSLDYSQNNRNLFTPSHLNEDNHSSTVGEIGRNTMILNETVFNYKLNLKSGHNLDLMLGYSYQYDTDGYIAGSALNGPSDLVKYASGGWPGLFLQDNDKIKALQSYSSNFTEKKMASTFGRLNYNYKQKYIATMMLRRDGSSVFGKNVRWATFPSVGLAWNFSEEGFMKYFTALNFGKLRTSYGVSGNQFSNPYLAYGILSPYNIYNGNPSMQPNYTSGYYNPDLTWEETKQFDVGLDLTMFKGKATFTFDYYNRKTDQMLILTNIPSNYNGYVKVWRNGAGLSNDGLEFELRYRVFNNDKVTWNVSLNLAKNWNRFMSSFNNRDIGKYILGKSVGGIYGYQMDGIIQNEDDITKYWGQDGIYQAIGGDSYSDMGEYKIRDVNKDNKITSADEIYLGSTLPTLYGGIVSELRYGDFDLNMLFSYSLGRDMVYVLGEGSLATLPSTTLGAPLFIDRDKITFWEREGDNSHYAINRAGKGTPTSSRNIQNVNYLKLKTLTLGYTLPKNITRKIYLGDVRVFFSAENLFTWTNYEGGLDPETVDIDTGLDYGKNYPLARKLTLGLTVKF